MLLSSSNNTANFAAGYYDAFMVSTEIPDIPGTISYQIGHVHTGSSRGGGCYTVYLRTESGTEKWQEAHQWSYSNSAADNVCTVCGMHSGFQGYQLGGTHTRSRDYTYKVYALGCGYENGEYVRDTDEPTDLTANEKIISATITY